MEDTEVFKGYNTYIETFQAMVNDRAFEFMPRLQEMRSWSVTLIEHPEEEVMDFNRLYAQAQGYHSNTVTLSMDISTEKSQWSSWQRNLKHTYKRVRSDLLGNNKRIQGLRNQGLQEAAVETAVPDLVQLMFDVDESIQQLDVMHGLVERKLNDFDKILTTLAKQQRIVDTLIGIGYAVKPGFRVTMKNPDK